jgi:hypothetical protein
VAAATSPELAAHVRECRACADLAVVTDAFQRARANAAGPVHKTAPGLLWWRAQLRRREAAMEQIGKPILGAQIFALALNLAVALGFVAWEATHGVEWLSWFGPQRQAGGLGALVVAAFSGLGLVVFVPVLAALALLGAAAVYLAAEKS